MQDGLNEQKEKLLALREDYKQALLGEVKELKTDIIETKNWLLLVGSAVILGYVAVKVVTSVVGLFGSKEEKVREVIIEKPYQVYDAKKVEKDSFLSPIVRAITQEIKLFLLGIAKQALRDFLQRMMTKEVAKEENKS
jgi:hypothetical protein